MDFAAREQGVVYARVQERRRIGTAPSMNARTHQEAERIYVWIYKPEIVKIKDGEEEHVGEALPLARQLKPYEPALLIEPSMRLHDEGTLFLRRQYVESGKCASRHTWASAAYGLASWFDYLLASHIQDWRIATLSDLISYRDDYAAAVSQKSGQVYAAGTIANRISVIVVFYNFAHEQGWYTGDISSVTTGGTARTPVVRRGARQTGPAARIAPTRRASRDAIRPFLLSELPAFLAAVGPQASSAKKTEGRSARDRLIVDLGWAVGLRNDEIHQLTVDQFLSLVPEPDAPAAHQPLRVLGKGRLKRTVAIPNWLVLDALAYINNEAGERKESLRNARRQAARSPQSVFLSSVKSNRCGFPITHRRMQQIVEEACISAGLTMNVTRTNPETGETFHDVVAKHCFHDLRHTYAVYTYWHEKACGNPEPWKKIQAQLGHAHLSTTVDTYLHFVDVFEGSESIPDIRSFLGF